MVVARLPDGISADDLIGAGTSGAIALHPTERIVIKFPHTPEDDDLQTDQRCKFEAEAYERLEASGRPSSILRYIGRYEDDRVQGILLEYAPHGSLTHFLKSSKPNNELRMRWSLQAVEALDFCHRQDVLHGDICANNFLLDGNFNLKLADFTGASFSGSRSVGCYGSSHLWPGLTEEEREDPWNIQMDSRTELFALGSALFEIWTGRAPLCDLTESEKLEEFRAGNFPVVDCPLQSIIHSCWRGDFNNTSQLYSQLQSLTKAFIHKSEHNPNRKGSLNVLPSTLVKSLFGMPFASTVPILCLAGSALLYHIWYRRSYWSLMGDEPSVQSTLSGLLHRIPLSCDSLHG